MMLSENSYPLFIYKDYTLGDTPGGIRVTFNFTIEGLCDFSPEIIIDTGKIPRVNGFDSDTAKSIVFCLGLVEAVSYFKAVCPEKIRIDCGTLTDSQAQWFKKLWFNGLGEFFFVNKMNVTLEDFITVESHGKAAPVSGSYTSAGRCIIPVGGGKDSCVTAELLKAHKSRNLFLTVNDQPARTDCIIAAGYCADSVIRVTRTIDKRLLELNKRGFYNGHTPFSAIVAFISLYCAYITGSDNIALSNESSANEGNTDGGVNHQYSKSYEFETDFSEFVAESITDKIRYFSLLRPFNELQIAKYFAAQKKYLPVFRSCNRGSKKNIWCCECAKCLFVYGILSPFLSDCELDAVFGERLFENEELLECFKGLTGINPVKPFECVGTAREYVYAVSVKIQRIKQGGGELPALLKYFDSVTDTKATASDSSLLREFNAQNSVPPVFADAVREMYDYVSRN